MAVDKLLKQNFWAVILVLAAVAAFFSAQGVMQVVGTGLAPDETQLALPPLMARVAPPPASASPHATEAAPILARNPFDSVTGPLDAHPPPEEEDAGAPGPLPITFDDPYDAPECDGVHVLIITAASDPDWSFAALETQAEKGKTYLRRRGGEIGTSTVWFVGWDRVWLVNGNVLCQVRMFKPPALPDAGAVVAAAPPPPPPAGGPGAVGDDIRKGIQKKSATEFDVDRGVVDKIL